MFDFKELIKDIQKYFDSGGGHSFDHIERVYNLAMELAKDEKVDLDILKAAVLLHDVARLKQWKNEVECHAEEGARMAPEILRKHKFPEEKIEDVIHCVMVHRKGKFLEPKTREAEILHDADLLDLLGAIGILRATAHLYNRRLYDENEEEPKEFRFRDKSKEPKTVLNWLYALSLMELSFFKTEKAREFGKERLDYLKDFIKHFKKEWKGEL
ncbi:phosphohydrolase [Candidatus Woesearchaeota archaeon B3_Woes]|nr:MAG: phosphohydrolase [Candidatus Woesearchaeota archaeon B3_Woes]